MIEARVRKRTPEGFELDVDWKTEARSVVVLGPPGSGKTMLLECLCGFARPDEGRITLNGEVVFDGAAKVEIPPARRRCAYVPSGESLLPSMTIKQNLAFAVLKGGRLERRRKVDVMLDEAELMARADEYPWALSAGERFRACVARALLSGPKLLVIDEPEKGLTAELREEVRAAVDAAARGHGVRVVLAGQSAENWLDLAEEVVVLSNGKLLRQGASEAVLDEPETAEVARLLGRHAVLEAEIMAIDPARRLCRLRCGPETDAAFEVLGPYFPGLLKGSRVQVAVRVDGLRAPAREGEGVARVVERVTEGVSRVRLHFEGGLMAEMGRKEWEPHRHNKKWMVAIPPPAVRLLR